jgi:signal transduction histidine kinase
MSLYRRVTVGAFVIAACLIGLTFLSSQYILLDSYRQLENQNITMSLKQVRSILQSDIDSLKVNDLEWLERPSPRYLPSPSLAINNDSDLFDQMSLAAKLNVSLLLDRENNIVFQNVIDADDQKHASIPQAILASVKSNGPLVDEDNPKTIIKGIIAIPQGLLMTISMPVFSASGKDASWGRLIVGRYIDDKEINHLRERLKLDVDIAAYQDDQATDDFQAAKSNLELHNSYYITPVDSQFVAGYTVMSDLFGEPALILRVIIPRSIYQNGQTSISSFLVVLVIIIVLLVGAAFLFLERTVLSRLTTLNTGLVHIESSESLTLEVPTTGHDEISSLTSKIKQILKDYSRSRSQLEEIQSKFETQVTERTAELKNTNSRLEQELGEEKTIRQNLAQSYDKAVNELQIKSQILTNVSHDARTPLTIITLNADMLQRERHGELNTKQNEVLDRILNAAKHLHSFMTNTLDEAQLKHGKVSLSHVDFEPKLLIEEFARLLAPLAESKGIELNTEIDLALPGKIKGDPDRLKQVLSNLTENAIKFTEKGSVTIQALRTDSQHWAIQVSDTGRGIPTEVQSRIFEAYWQLNSTQKRDSNSGVGLGLSIVKQVVQLMNGSITVESKVGHGTTFTIMLPIERENETLVTQSVPQVKV